MRNFKIACLAERKRSFYSNCNPKNRPGKTSMIKFLPIAASILLYMHSPKGNSALDVIGAASNTRCVLCILIALNIWVEAALFYFG